MMALELGFLLNTSSAAELFAFFPFQPIEGILQLGRVAKGTAGMLNLGELSVLHFLYCEIHSFGVSNYLSDQFFRYVISVNEISSEIEFKGSDSFFSLFFLYIFEAGQLRIFELFLDVFFGKHTDELFYCFFGFGIHIAGSSFFWLQRRILLLIQKLVDSGFQLNLRRMANVVDFSPSIHQTHEWNTIDFELFDQRMLMLPPQKSQMSHFLPLFACYSLFDHLFFVIYANSNDSYPFSPNPFILLQHLLIVFHGFLTWPTPSRPNINQQNFSRLMSEQSFSLIENIINLSVVIESSSSFLDHIEITVYLKLLHFLINGIKFVLMGWLKQKNYSQILNFLCNLCCSRSFLDQAQSIIGNDSSLMSLKLFENLLCFLDHLIQYILQEGFIYNRSSNRF